MAAIMFDTHAFVKELTQAGMPEQQAEVLARSQAMLIDEKLATKEDLKNLELATKRDLKELELATKRDLKELETRIWAQLERTGVTFDVAPRIHDGGCHRRSRRSGQVAVNPEQTGTSENLTQAKELIRAAQVWRCNLFAETTACLGTGR